MAAMSWSIAFVETANAAVHVPLAVASADLCALLVDLTDDDVSSEEQAIAKSIMVCAELADTLAPVKTALGALSVALQAALQAAQQPPVNQTLVGELTRELAAATSAGDAVRNLTSCTATRAALRELLPLVCGQGMAVEAFALASLAAALALLALLALVVVIFKRHQVEVDGYARFYDDDGDVNARLMSYERQSYGTTLDRTSGGGGGATSRVFRD